MPLPIGITQLSSASSSSSHPAYLFRPSQEVWTKLQSTSTDLTISFDNDDIHLNIPGSSPISLTPQSSNTPSEIYSLRKDRLEPVGIASTRLTIPIGSTKPKSLGSQLKAPIPGTALKSPLLSASLAHGQSMGRTLSSPGPVTVKSAPEPVTPLKTRVIQVLALGPTSVDEIVSKVGMAREDVMRVVRAVGKDLGDDRYTLQPTKYAQIKLASWKYTSAEQQTVIRLAREAFDELGLPSDAEERAELALKEAEIKSGPSSRSESGSESVPLPLPRKEIDSTPLSSPRVVPSTSHGNGSDVSKSNEKPVKKKKSVGLIGRERAKFAAQQQRASSMPNGRSSGNLASPRLDPTPSAASVEPKKMVPAKAKRKREDPAPSASGPASPAESSAGTSTSEEARGRGKGAKPLKSTPLVNGHRPEPKKKASKATARDYSSSESDSESETTPLSRRKGHTETPSSPVLTPRTSSIPSFKRKAPPELELNGHTNGHTSPPPSKRARPNEEALRDRYEELFPAYQLYTRKLLKIQQELQEGHEGQGEEEGEVVDQVEVGRMVKKWEKWHRELEDIRKWFGESPRSGSS